MKNKNGVKVDLKNKIINRIKNMCDTCGCGEETKKEEEEEEEK